MFTEQHYRHSFGFIELFLIFRVRLSANWKSVFPWGSWGVHEIVFHQYLGSFTTKKLMGLSMPVNLQYEFQRRLISRKFGVKIFKLINPLLQLWIIKRLIGKVETQSPTYFDKQSQNTMQSLGANRCGCSPLGSTQRNGNFIPGA